MAGGGRSGVVVVVSAALFALPIVCNRSCVFFLPTTPTRSEDGGAAELEGLVLALRPAARRISVQPRMVFEEVGPSCDANREHSRSGRAPFDRALLEDGFQQRSDRRRPAGTQRHVAAGGIGLWQRRPVGMSTLASWTWVGEFAKWKGTPAGGSCFPNERRASVYKQDFDGLWTYQMNTNPTLGPHAVCGKKSTAPIVHGARSASRDSDEKTRTSTSSSVSLNQSWS